MKPLSEVALGFLVIQIQIQAVCVEDPLSFWPHVGVCQNSKIFKSIRSKNEKNFSPFPPRVFFVISHECQIFWSDLAQKKLEDKWKIGPELILQK